MPTTRIRDGGTGEFLSRMRDWKIEGVHVEDEGWRGRGCPRPELGRGKCESGLVSNGEAEDRRVRGEHGAESHEVGASRNNRSSAKSLAGANGLLLLLPMASRRRVSKNKQQARWESCRRCEEE